MAFNQKRYFDWGDRWWSPSNVSHPPVPGVHRSNSMPLSGLWTAVDSGLRQLEADEAVELANCLGCVLASSSCFSNECSCCMKWKFGSMLALRFSTMLYASFSVSCRWAIKQASITVTERDMPARQCTKTPFFCVRPLSAKTTFDQLHLKTIVKIIYNNIDK